MVGSIDSDIKVIRSDELTVEEIRALKPGLRDTFTQAWQDQLMRAYTKTLLRECKGEFPILGVCLGPKPSAEVFRGTVSYAKQVMHGKQSVAKQITIENP